MYNKNTHTICDIKIGYHLHSLKIAYILTVKRPQFYTHKSKLIFLQTQIDTFSTSPLATIPEKSRIKS